MNIQLFTDDDYRENVLKHIEVDQPLNIGATYLQSVKARVGNTYSSGNISRGNTKHLSGRHTQNSSIHIGSSFSPLFASIELRRSLMPSPTFHSHRSEAFAEDLVDEINLEGGK